MSKTLIPDEHYSFTKNFKKSPWISNSSLLLRIPIMLLFLIWSVPTDAQGKYLYSMHLFMMMIRRLNIIALPFHTLLICKSEIDRMYLIHLIGFSLTWLWHSVLRCIQAVISETDRNYHCLVSIMVLLLAICFLIWSVPTRILYVRTFHIARKCIGIHPDSLYSRFNMGLVGLLIFWILSNGILCLVKIYCPNVDHVFLFYQLDTIFMGLWAWFEIYMYSAIDPYKRIHRNGPNLIEKMYFFGGLFLICMPMAMIIAYIVLEVPQWVGDCQWAFVRVVLAARFIVLWYYCLEELRLYSAKPDIEENVIPEEAKVRFDMVDLTSIPLEQIEKMEI